MSKADNDQQPRTWMTRLLRGGKENHLPKCREKNIINIGWGQYTKGLNTGLDWSEFKKKFNEYHKIENNRVLGQRAGQAWGFLEMGKGDYVIVPRWSELHVAKITSKYHEYKGEELGYTWGVEWLTTEEKTIRRNWASAALHAKLNYRGTHCLAAKDNKEIESLLSGVEKKGDKPFLLKAQMTERICEFLQSGEANLNPDSWEKLVKGLLLSLGAKEPRRIGKRADQGDDVVAEFPHLGVKVVCQVKFHSGTTDRKALDQLVNALKNKYENEEPNVLGWVITSAEFKDDVYDLLNDEYAEHNLRLINGMELAALILEHGIDFNKFTTDRMRP